MRIIRLLFVFLLVFVCSNQKSVAKNQFEAPEPVIQLSKIDSLILTKFWQQAMDSHMVSKTIPEIEMWVAHRFVGIPYVAGTLDQNKEEQLVVNLHGLDCVTYLENVLALTLCIKSGTLNNQSFFRNLKNLRYRHGIMDGYASRLHYFTEWLHDNRQKRILFLVSDSLGNADFNPMVNILSKNKDKNVLLSDSAVLAKIIESEIEVSKMKLRYITKQHLSEVEASIHDGDIIALATTIKGLDIVHTGIAIKKDNRLFMMHASSTMGEVVITDVPLSEYLQQKTSYTGVLIARLIGN